MRVWVGLGVLWGFFCALAPLAYAREPAFFECSFRLYSLEFPRPATPWTKWGIETLAHYRGLSANGGIAFDEDELFGTNNPHKKYSAEWEVRAARRFSEEGEAFLGVGDASVGRVLDSAYDRKVNSPNGQISSFPDLLSVLMHRKKQPRFRLREIKTGVLATQSLKRAIKQLESGARWLLRRVPDAQIDRLEIVVDPSSYVDSVLGKSLEEDRYEVAVRGVVSTIQVGRRRIPVTLLRMEPDTDTETQLD